MLAVAAPDDRQLAGATRRARSGGIMPRLSLDTLLQRALEPAIHDRRTYAAAWGDEGPEAEEALALVRAIRALRGRPFASLSPAEQRTAWEVFEAAERWETSFADSDPGARWERAARRAARLYRTQRIALAARIHADCGPRAPLDRP